MVLARQPVEGEGVLDCFLDPIDELLITGAPFGDPGGKIAAGLLDIPPVIKPAQLLQAVVVGALSTCQIKDVKDHRLARAYAAVAASRHVLIAAARRARWVRRVVR